MVIDYRLLNNILESDPYPVPDIKQILNKISEQKLYTVMDLHSAFFQIRIREEDKPKLAFVTDEAQLTMNRLPFGTKISSGQFARLIDKVLGLLKNKYNIKYFIADVIIATQTEQQMNDTLHEILTQLEKYNLTIEPTKLELYQSEIEFLGYNIDQNGYAPSDKNISNISNFAVPKTQKDVKAFVGSCNYFKSTIHNFAHIITPLTNLTKKILNFIGMKQHKKHLTQYNK